MSDHDDFLSPEQRFALRFHDRAEEGESQTNQGTMDAGIAAVRTFFVLNGAGCIAILAFFGGLPVGAYPELVSALPQALRNMAFGSASAAAAAGLTYITNYIHTATYSSQIHIFKHPYVEDTRTSKLLRRAGNTCQSIAVVSAVASLGFFLWAVWGLQAGMAEAVNDRRDMEMHLPTIDAGGSEPSAGGQAVPGQAAHVEEG